MELEQIVEQAQTLLYSSGMLCLFLAVLNGKVKPPVQVLIASEQCDSTRESLNIPILTESQKTPIHSNSSFTLPPMCWACPASQKIRQPLQELSQKAKALKK
ncbi:MAG: hypothetical protein WCT22_00030 [Patescibacteria group bacterium]|jgi:hypothetical protein